MSITGYIDKASHFHFKDRQFSQSVKLNFPTNLLSFNECKLKLSAHAMYGETEEELLENAKRYGIEVYGYTKEQWDEEVSKNKDHFRKLMKSS
jgi:hypothetical protein